MYFDHLFNPATWLFALPFLLAAFVSTSFMFGETLPDARKVRITYGLRGNGKLNVIEMPPALLAWHRRLLACRFGWTALCTIVFVATSVAARATYVHIAVPMTTVPGHEYAAHFFVVQFVAIVPLFGIPFVTPKNRSHAQLFCLNWGIEAAEGSSEIMMTHYVPVVIWGCTCAVLSLPREIPCNTTPILLIGYITAAAVFGKSAWNACFTHLCPNPRVRQDAAVAALNKP